MRRKWLWVLAAAAFLLVLSALLRPLYPPLRHPLDALLLAQSLLAKEEKSWLARWTLPPERREETPGDVPLDFYIPGGSDEPPRGCILLAHGMTDAGRRDARLAAFARSLARLGFAVAAPDLPGMRRFRPDVRDVARLASTFAWLDGRRPPSVPRCGLFGLSFSAGPAFLAAARPEVAGRVGYMIAVGAYYDLREVLLHLTTSGRGHEPAFPGGPPLWTGKWLFLRYNADLLGLDGHEAEVEAIVRRKLADEKADIASLVSRLPEEGRGVLALMENTDAALFDAIYRSQPPAMRQRLEAWSLEGVVRRGGYPLFLIHGRGDPLVPFSAGVHLAREAREVPGRKVRLLIVEALGHVDASKTPFSVRKLGETAQLLGFLSEALSAMEKN
ncbi:MAG: hypothetical protein HYZ11_10480 [Candidatus Tectomicrobia bacterium]|uniref:Alpha/beta hydrolase n=1 Tax=Tectimicrobiota bacterium TaxID=2528274 RepID=A0A932HZP7_UNCTE|nr:hypothetical protein [Candidatus Tectomicrobia bacterium]